MTGCRAFTSVLIAACWLVPSVANAQGFGGGGPYSQPAWADPYAPGGYGSPHAPPTMTQKAPTGMRLAPVYAETPPTNKKGRYGQAAYEQPAGQRGRVNPASYAADYPMARVGQQIVGPRSGPYDPVAPTDPRQPYQVGTPYTAVPGQGYYGPDGMITKHDPNEDSWDEGGPLELMLTTALRNSWIRAEYLLWDIQDPHGVYMGAPLANNVDLNGFTVIDPANFPNQLGTARVFDTNRLGLNDTNGMKLTYGIPLMKGDAEISGFKLFHREDKDTAGELPSPDAPFGRFIATTTLTNGQLGSNVLLYDESFSVTYDSDIWGADFKYLFDTARPGEGFKIRPLIGARFLSIREQMIQQGVYNNFDTIPDLISVIDSEANNHFFGGMAGVRLEFVHRWFTVGIEPRGSAGLNRYLARVETKNLRGVQDGVFRTEEKDTIFAPVFEGNAYLRVHVHENFSLNVGYNWLGVWNVTRPAKNIYYNDNGPQAPPGVVVDAKHNEMFIRGLTVGGEIRFR